MADVACPVVCQPVWPACWLDTPDRSSSSSTRVVQDVWYVFWDELGVVPDDVVLALQDAVSWSSVDDFWSSLVAVNKVIDAPVMQAVRVPQVVIIPVAAQRRTSMVLLTMEIPQLLLDKVFDVPVCRW